MTIKETLNKTAHRPWELPEKPWQYYQEWNDAIFLHYPVELSELKKFIPNDLKIDLFDGTPWVSVVAFNMEKVRLKYLPHFPAISNFYEVNIRTYVKGNNKPGVYFLSIEGGNRLSCKIAKKLSGLPYRYSKMKRPKNRFISFNNGFNDHFDVSFTIGEEIISKTDLDLWLTERYALFQDSNQKINQYEIHHGEWPIRHLDIKQLHLSYSRFKELLKGSPQQIHYSYGVEVMAWGKSSL